MFLLYFVFFIIITSHPLKNNYISRLPQEASDETYKLLVESLNLRDVMCTKGVDWKNTTSNHILEVRCIMCKRTEARQRTLARHLSG